MLGEVGMREKKESATCQKDSRQALERCRPENERSKPNIKFKKTNGLLTRKISRKDGSGVYKVLEKQG